MPQPRPVQFVLPALIIANLVIKLLWLGRNELAHDEPFTVLMAHRDLTDLFSALREENNPPLYFLLMKAWCWIVPLDAALLRVPSALFSALAVWPLFLLGRAAGGPRIALVGSLLFTFCNYHFGFAHEVRAYSLFTLLAVLTMWQLWRASSGAPRTVLWLVLTGAAMVYTHFFGWLMLGIGSCCVFLVKDLRPARKAYLVSLGIIAVSYLPYAAIFLGRLGTSVEQGTWLTAPEPEELYNMIWRWSNAPVIAVLFLVVIILATLRTGARGAAMGIALIWTFVPLLGMYLASFITPMFLDRYLVYAAPGFALVVAASLEGLRLPERLNSMTAAACVAGMLFTFTPWRSNGLHPSAVVQAVDRMRAGGDPVLIQPWWYMNTYAWHAERDLVLDPMNLQWNLSKRFDYPVDQARDMPIVPKDYSSVLLVDAGSDLVDPDHTVKQQLAHAFARVDSMETDHRVRVYRFSN